MSENAVVFINTCKEKVYLTVLKQPALQNTCKSGNILNDNVISMTASMTISAEILYQQNQKNT